MSTEFIRPEEILLRKSERKNDRDAILDAVVRPCIAEIIRKAGLEPMAFISDDSSIRAFMRLPITHKEVDGTFCCVYYDCCASDVYYRAECRVAINVDNVIAETNLYRLDGYNEGNREWLWFDGTDWLEGAGEMFDFDSLPMIKDI